MALKNRGYALPMTTGILTSRPSRPSRPSRRQRIDALADRIASLAATLDVTTHQLLTAIRAFDAEKGWALQGARSCAHWLVWRTGRDARTAREWVRVANRLGELPKMDETLKEGAVSYTKVRAMTRVANADNEELLLAQAKTATGAQLERVCASFAGVKKTIDKAEDPDVLDDRRHVRRRFLRDGTVVIEARLLPDEAEAVMQALHATKASLGPRARRAADDMPAENGPAEPPAPRGSEDMPAENGPAEPPDPNLADALVAVAERQIAALEDAANDAADAGNDAGNEGATLARAPRRRELVIHLRTSDLIEGAWQAELHDGTPLRGETFQRLACDTGVVVAHTDEDGSPLDVGRRRRTIPAALRRALLLRDRCCRFPGCTQQAFVEAHHIEHWSGGGATDKDNLVLLCHAHHVALHEGGFSAERAEDGHLVVRDPRGRVIPHVPEPASPELVTDHPDPRTNLIDWDGSRADIHGAVRALVGRELGLLH